MANKGRRRVLLVTRNFPPVHGGMERLNLHVALELASGYDVHVVAPQGARKLLPESIDVSEVALAPLWRFGLASLMRSMHVAWRWRPDVVVAGSGLTAPMAWLSARVCRAASLAYVHGLDIVVPHRVYRFAWWRALRSLTRLVANSHATAKLAVNAGVPADRIGIVHPGVHTRVAHDAGADTAFRLKYGLGKGPLLLSVGRLTRRKGLAGFLREVMPTLVRRHPDMVLVVIGSAPVHALYGVGNTPEQLVELARASGVDSHVRWLGDVDEATLESAFAAASVHVFPIRTIESDPEGFGMVAIEAAARGVPTVAYASGGVTDAVQDDVSGALITHGDAAGFIQAVERFLEDPLPASPMQAFAEQFDWRHFGQRLRAEVEQARTVQRNGR